MSAEYNWKLLPETGWEPLESFTTGDSTPKFVSAEQSVDRILIRYFWDPERRDARAHMRMGQHAQGPPGHVHGGCLASILDELMGLAAWRNELAVVARELTIRYRKPTPLWTELVGHAWIERVEGRNAWIRGHIANPDGTVYVESEGVFTDIGGDRFRELAAGAREVRAQQ